MGKYNIISIDTIKYTKYSDVLRVIARRKRGLFVSLFVSSKETIFILSEESPMADSAKSAKKSNSLWSVEYTMFELEFLNGRTYHVEKKMDQYEQRKANKATIEKENQSQREREKQEAEEKRRKLEEERQKQCIDAAFDKAKIQKISMSQIRMVADKDASFSDQMAAIAGNANLCFLMGNKDEFVKNIIKLYNLVHGYNSHRLKTVTSKDGQCIGLAFIKMAMYFSNGDSQVNEIAAQNACYCIVKNFKNDNNTYALPALFSLLLKKPQTLMDELYSVNPDSSLVGMGSMLPSSPYRRKDRATSNRLPIMKFLLQTFYDEGNKKFTIDTTLPYHIPSVNDVSTFMREYTKSNYATNSNSESIGESYLYALYENIEEQLNL